MESTSTQLWYSVANNFVARRGTKRAKTPRNIDEQLFPTADTPQDSAPGPHPMFTAEESSVMRAVSAGQSDNQVCIAMRMPLGSFHGLRHDLMAKTRTRDRLGLLVWAARERLGDDSRESERHYKLKTTRAGDVTPPMLRIVSTMMGMANRSEGTHGCR